MRTSSSPMQPILSGCSPHIDGSKHRRFQERTCCFCPFLALLMRRYTKRGTGIRETYFISVAWERTSSTDPGSKPRVLRDYSRPTSISTSWSPVHRRLAIAEDCTVTRTFQANALSRAGKDDLWNLWLESSLIAAMHKTRSRVSERKESGR